MRRMFSQKVVWRRWGRFVLKERLEWVLVTSCPLHMATGDDCAHSPEEHMDDKVKTLLPSAAPERYSWVHRPCGRGANFHNYLGSSLPLPELLVLVVSWCGSGVLVTLSWGLYLPISMDAACTRTCTSPRPNHMLEAPGHPTVGVYTGNHALNQGIFPQLWFRIIALPLSKPTAPCSWGLGSCQDTPCPCTGAPGSPKTAGLCFMLAYPQLARAGVLGPPLKGAY